MPEKYVKVNDVKKKLNYVFNANGVPKVVRQAIYKCFDKVPYYVKGDLETTLDSKEE